jgi:predicted transport protein
LIKWALADIKLFRIENDSVAELPAESVAIEKSLQSLLEKHLEAFLGVRFLASEYATGKTHGGRIDTLGLDDNNCPVIIEYKRALNENVINQGLYYLDWLMDHRAEFTLLVMKKFDPEVSEQIEWTSPRLLCIAGDFTKFDEHAVQQINRNIELLRYRRYGQCLLLLELVNASSAESVAVIPSALEESNKSKPQYKGFADRLPLCSADLKDLWEALRAFLLDLGDDVQEKQLKFYVAFRRLRNFASCDVHSQSGELLVYTKVDPAKISLEEGFTRDVTHRGHYGTGDLEIRIRATADLERAKPMLIEAYRDN